MQKAYVHSILDTDLYKLTQQNAVIKLFPQEYVRYEFINRDKRPFPAGFDVKLRNAVNSMADLALTPEEQKFLQINKEKALIFADHGINYADFGSRRRFSFANHNRVIQDLLTYNTGNFTGTSNPYLAYKHSLTPIGTQAHEWYMLIGAKYGYRMANTVGLEKWVEVYQGSLGIALTDTFTSDVFFKSFNLKYAKLFDGIRQDSGDPITFAKKAITHYEKLRINPLSKTIVFSDNLNTNKVLEIENFCKGLIKTSYGIGTFLTNDIPGIKPLNIVIKLTAWWDSDRRAIPTVKLSDDPGKHTGDSDAVSLCKKTLNLE